MLHAEKDGRGILTVGKMPDKECQRDVGRRPRFALR
jgi:hypothetical protein